MNIESNVQSDVVFRHILVPHDLTLHADRALHLAGTMAHPQLSRIILVNVMDPGEAHQDVSNHFISKASDLARDRWRFLNFAAKRLIPADVNVEIRVLSGHPQNIILEEARNLGADLLIMTTHPHSGVGYPFRSWAEGNVQRAAPCPVLILPVGGENGDSIGVPKLSQMETHSLAQYCAISRRLSKDKEHRPVFIGYSALPSSLRGACEDER